jgi:hypothetical protein
VASNALRAALSSPASRRGQLPGLLDLLLESLELEVVAGEHGLGLGPPRLELDQLVARVRELGANRLELLTTLRALRLPAASASSFSIASAWWSSASTDRRVLSSTVRSSTMSARVRAELVARELELPGLRRELTGLRGDLCRLRRDLGFERGDRSAGPAPAPTTLRSTRLELGDGVERGNPILFRLRVRLFAVGGDELQLRDAIATRGERALDLGALGVGTGDRLLELADAGAGLFEVGVRGVALVDTLDDGRLQLGRSGQQRTQLGLGAGRPRRACARPGPPR